MIAAAAVPTSPTERNRLFQALSDETRLAILDLLYGGERCVCELQDALGAAQSRLSFHLKVLREAGLVADRKEGRWSYYALVPARFEAAAQAIAAYARPSSRRAGGRPTLHRLTRSRRPLAANRPDASGPEAAPDCCG